MLPQIFLCFIAFASLSLTKGRSHAIRPHAAQTLPEIEQNVLEPLGNDTSARAISRLPEVWEQIKHDALPLEGEIWWSDLQSRHRTLMHHLLTQKKHLDLVIFGDSITELLEGTSRGWPHDASRDVPLEWRASFPSWRAVPLGISGDRTNNLLWRLTEGGEAPAGLQVRHAIIEIGTNDFYNHYAQLYGAVAMSETVEISTALAQGILACANALHKRWPATSIWVLGLLPRGNINPEAWHLPSDFAWPSLFTEVILEVNRMLAVAIKQVHGVSFMECGHALLTPARDQISSNLVQDGLHPSAAGYERLLACMQQHVQ